MLLKKLIAVPTNYYPDIAYEPDCITHTHFIF